MLFRSKGDTQTTPQLDEGITDAIWVNSDDLPGVLANTYESIKEVFRAAGLV